MTAATLAYMRTREQFCEYIEVFKVESQNILSNKSFEAGREEIEKCLLMLVMSSEKALLCADQLAAQIGDAEVGALAMLLERVVSIVAVSSSLSRHFDEPTATHTRVIHKNWTVEPLKIKAEDDTATFAVALPLILKALGNSGRLKNREKLLEAVNAALTATFDRKGKQREPIGLRTLGRWTKDAKNGQAGSLSN